MNEKIKFSYEDAVDYVLNKMDPQLREKFENELKNDEELQKFIHKAQANKDILEEYDKIELDDEFHKITFNKLQNLQSSIGEIKPGQIYLINSEGFKKLEKQALQDLYFLTLSDPSNSLTGKDIRVVPLSKYVLFAKNYDLIFTEKLISFKKFGVVAHMHLVTNVLVNRLNYFLGEIDKENFEAILRADRHDYSLIDGVKILKGESLEHVDDDYIREEAEVWYNLVYDLVQKLRFEIFDKIGATEEIEYDKEKSELTLTNNSMRKKDFVNTFYLSAINSYPSKEDPSEKKSYEIDEDGFIIARYDKHLIKSKFENSEEFLPLNLRTKKVSFEDIEHLIYQEISDREFTDYLRQLKKEFKVREPETSRSYKLAAKANSLYNDLPDYFRLFDDKKMQVLLSFTGDYTNLTISFHENQEPEKIKNFYFVNISEQSITLIPEIQVQQGNVFIPLKLNRDQILALQHGFIIGFQMKKLSINLHLKLVVH